MRTLINPTSRSEKRAVLLSLDETWRNVGVIVHLISLPSAFYTLTALVGALFIEMYWMQVDLLHPGYCNQI